MNNKEPSLAPILCRSRISREVEETFFFFFFLFLLFGLLLDSLFLVLFRSFFCCVPLPIPYLELPNFRFSAPFNTLVLRFSTLLMSWVVRLICNFPNKTPYIPCVLLCYIPNRQIYPGLPTEHSIAGTSIGTHLRSCDKTRILTRRLHVDARRQPIFL